MLLAEITAEAGVPDGVINLVNGLRDDAARPHGTSDIGLPLVGDSATARHYETRCRHIEEGPLSWAARTLLSYLRTPI